MIPVFKALVSTGIMGKGIYMQVFPEDATPEMKSDIEEETEKNA